MRRDESVNEANTKEKKKTTDRLELAVVTLPSTQVTVRTPGDANKETAAIVEGLVKLPRKSVSGVTMTMADCDVKND